MTEGPDATDPQATDASPSDRSSGDSSGDLNRDSSEQIAATTPAGVAGRFSALRSLLHLEAAIAGAAGAGVALGFGELIEGASETMPSLVVAVGELIADYTPGDVVAASIANLGSSQKTVLTVGIVIGTVLLGALLGHLGASGKRRASIAGFAAFGLIGGWAAARNPFSGTAESWIVAVCATALAIGTWQFLLSRIKHDAAPVEQDPATAEEGLEEGLPDLGTDLAVQPDDLGVRNRRQHARRAFFGYVTGAATSAVAMVGVGRSLRGPSAAEQARETIEIPPAASTATISPASDGSVAGQVAALDTFDDVNGIAPYVTPNTDFYRIDTALVVPQVDPASWRLSFTGLVDNPYEITFDEILAMDLSDHVITLSCVSNRVGGNLVGNAIWTGVPLAELLERAGAQAGAEQVVGRSVDDWTAGFPIDAVYGRNTILAVGMNGEPLPTRHGFPARLVVPGLYGYVSAVKWIEEIQLTTWDGFDGYWVPRGWAKEGPMKTQSRIDVPRGGENLTAGVPTPIAGVAWAPTRGISAVEVSTDGETWQQCELGEVLGNESWAQWHTTWTPTAGRTELRVRATDGTGATQSPGPVPPRPDGAEGWHTVTVNVA